MGAIASQITSLTIIYSTVYSGADQSKHQSSASLAFVWGIYRGPVNSPHKWPVTPKMFPFDDVIMSSACILYGANVTRDVQGSDNVSNHCRHWLTQCPSYWRYWSSIATRGKALTKWGQNKTSAILQTMFSHSFSCLKVVVIWCKFRLNQFPIVQLTIGQHWFRQWLDTEQAINHYLNQWSRSLPPHI